MVPVVQLVQDVLDSWGRLQRLRGDVALSEQEGLKNYYWDVESVHTVSSVRYTLWWCAYRTCESMWSART